MKIKKIELNNFKRFTHLSVEDIPKNNKVGNLSWSEWFGKDIVYGSDEPLL